jgi:hypothetical protein
LRSDLWRPWPQTDRQACLPMSKRLSRRVLIGGGGLAIGVLIEGGRAMPTVADEGISEADKIKQTDAHYQKFPKGPQRCQICLQFSSPDKCKIVQGPIIPQGWCQFFAARENAH